MKAAIILSALLFPVAAQAIVGEAREVGVPEDKLHSLSLEMCTPSKSKCSQFPLTEKSALYHQYSLDTCKTVGYGLAVMKANEWNRAEREGLRFNVRCVDRNYQVSFEKLYRWGELGVEP